MVTYRVAHVHYTNNYSGGSNTDFMQATVQIGIRSMQG